MRTPNPARVWLYGLSEDSVRKVVKLALEVVHLLAKEEDWQAYELWKHSGLDNEEKLGFWSCLDSHQRSTLSHIAEVDK